MIHGMGTHEPFYLNWKGQSARTGRFPKQRVQECFKHNDGCDYVVVACDDGFVCADRKGEVYLRCLLEPMVTWDCVRSFARALLDNSGGNRGVDDDAGEAVEA